jgi:hypothetical protein
MTGASCDAVELIAGVLVLIIGLLGACGSLSYRNGVDNDGQITKRQLCAKWFRHSFTSMIYYSMNTSGNQLLFSDIMIFGHKNRDSSTEKIDCGGNPNIMMLCKKYRRGFYGKKAHF